jgi:hypothetical protein
MKILKWEAGGSSARKLTFTVAHFSGMRSAITHPAMMYRQFLYARSIETLIERQPLSRKSILVSYAQAETDEFVYRPDLDYRDPADTLIIPTY